MIPLEPGSLASVAWPAGALLAGVAWHLLREARRRRRLNERLHELRRPLQALTLAARPSGSAPDFLALALAALRDLDREVNGERMPSGPRRIDARALLVATADRWRAQAARAGREIQVRWRGGAREGVGDPARIAQALDNLVANALEHASGPVVLAGAARGGRLELSVRSGAPAARPGPRGRRDPSRGHGLRASRAHARLSGGTLRTRARGSGRVAVIELPLGGPAAARAR